MLAMAAGLAAQVNLNHLGTIDLTSTSNPANPEYIGNNPSAIAWNGTDLYAAGFNQSGGTANTGITLVAGALSGGTPSAAFGVLATNNTRGYSGLDINGSGVVAAWDNGGAAPEGIQGFDLTGALLWQKNARGGSGVGFDPGFCGVDAGTGWTTFGSGRRALQDNATGADIYTTSNGMIILAPTSGTFWRDMDFAPNGDIYLRRGNDVVAHSRTGGNSLSGSRFVQDNGANGNFVAIQNVAYVDQGGGYVFWNDRSSTGTGQAFANVVKCNAADGTPVTLNFGAFTAPDGNGAYDFSYDSASKTLAIMDFNARTVDVFDVSLPSGLSTLTTTFAHNNGQAGNMFDIVANNAAGVTIDSFDVNLSSGTFDMEVYVKTAPGTFVGSEGNAADWTLVGSATGIVSNGAGVPTPLPISVCTFVPAGATQAFYVTTTTGGIRYTTNGAPWGSLYASNADLDFNAGSGNVYPFGSAFGNTTSSSRVWNGNINYSVGNNSCSLPSNASATTYGNGCYQFSASFYEVLTAAGMDLGGVKITGTATSLGYDITTAASGWTGPGLSAQAMALGDDDFQDSATVGGTLGVWVGSNGNIALNGANSNGFTPSVSTMLTNPETGIYAWTDLQPASGGGSNGDVFYEENGTVATVTYNGVDGWNTGDPNSIQFTYDTATGDWSILFGTVSGLNPEDWLVGYSPGGASLDPGATDISAGPFSIGSVDAAALALNSNAPKLGNNWDLQVSEAGASPLAFLYFGSAAVDPGVDLGSVGAPGCSAYTNADLSSFALTVSSGNASLCLPVPNDPALAGGSFSVQAAAATTLNALTVVTSNGLLGTFGN